MHEYYIRCENVGVSTILSVAGLYRGPIHHVFPRVVQLSGSGLNGYSLDYFKKN